MLIKLAVISDCVTESANILTSLRKNIVVALELLEAKYILGEPSVPYTP